MLYYNHKGDRKNPKIKKDSRQSVKRRKVKTMTKREFLSAVASAAISEEMTEYANTELAKMDAVNAKRRESDKPTKAQLEAAAARDRVIACIMQAEDAVDAEALAEVANVTKGQVPSALRALVTAGKVEKSTIKVDSKHRKTIYRYIGK